MTWVCATADKGTPIVVENVHLGDSLMTLCYQVNELDEDE